MPPLIPHFAFPLQVVDGQFRYVEQDSGEHLEQAARAVLQTPLGWLDTEPDMGLTSPVFQGRADLEEIERQLNEHVPGIDAHATEDLDRLNGLFAELGIDVTVGPA